MYRTAESVAIGHPDKVCDQIADAILDACLETDPTTRSAIEVMGGHGLITITGELTTNATVDIRAIAGEVYKNCGYEEQIGIVVNVCQQSSEIKSGVDNDGAGDQGIMVGYACNQTPELLPLEVVLSRKLARAIGRRDGKAQVTINNGQVQSFITSVCGELGMAGSMKFLQEVRAIIEPYLPDGKRLKDVWLRNPNGCWSIGGFAADSGLTGRKLAVDNYGPNIPIGGGAFSGKDATKVDRSGAYIARRIAVDYLRNREAREVFVHLAYAIGVAEPQMAVITIDGNQEVVTGYDLRPRAIIEFLDLQKPGYLETAKYGHFGNGFSWDR
jgi:S-adenosylmethionine synthetase